MAADYQDYDLWADCLETGIINELHMIYKCNNPILKAPSQACFLNLDLEQTDGNIQIHVHVPVNSLKMWNLHKGTQIFYTLQDIHFIKKNLNTQIYIYSTKSPDTVPESIMYLQTNSANKNMLLHASVKATKSKYYLSS